MQFILPILHSKSTEFRALWLHPSEWRQFKGIFIEFCRSESLKRIQKLNAGDLTQNEDVKTIESDKLAGPAGRQ